MRGRRRGLSKNPTRFYKNATNICGAIKKTRRLSAWFARYVFLKALFPSSFLFYFAVDFDATTSQIRNNIVPYFQGVLSVLNSSSKNPNGYKLGVYGSRAVCGYIRGSYSATTRYTFIVDNNWQGDFDDWNLRQYKFNQTLGSGTGQIKVDYVESSSHGGGGWKK
jgi:Domain of unknown function (DUF1906).